MAAAPTGPGPPASPLEVEASNKSVPAVPAALLPETAQACKRNVVAAEPSEWGSLSSTDTPEWLATIRRVKPGIVALRVTGARAFEDGNAGTWFGTGFVVDCTAGLILSNRHVITVSPIRAIAYFDQNEEIPCEPLYSDPIHDFGLLRFDPGALEFTPAVSIPLQPDELTVGTEIRVIGNDNTEKLQILPGTVARVDRNAPEYAGLYSDENTFYAGAASATSGGSSGSPVVNKRGHAVALNAGGAKEAASAYYLPLDCISYAVASLTDGRIPRRGTVGCRLHFRPYANAERLGLTAAQKAAAINANAVWSAAVPGRQPKRGVLVCDRVLPGSAAALAGVEPGDVLLSVDGVCCVDFAELERAIDAAAPEPWSGTTGKELTFVWARLGVERSTALRAADLHPLIPRDFVECGAAIFHSISYQRAMRWHIHTSQTGVYLSLAGIFGDVGSGTVVSELARGDQVWPTPDLDSLFRALKAVPDGVYFHVRYRDWSGNGHGRERSAQVRMDRRLWPLVLWKFEPSLPNRWLAAEDATVPAGTAEEGSSSMAAPPQFEEPLDGLQSSLTEVSFFVHTRLALEGIKPRGINAALFRCRGVGIVIDVERRLILTARSVVPQLLGTVEVTFRKSLTIEATPLLIHPELSLVILQLRKPFPPGVVAVRLGESSELFDSPQRGKFTGLDHRGHIVERECTITADEVWNPPILNPPRTRQGFNCELLLALNDEEIQDGLGGIFCLLDDEAAVTQAAEVADEQWSAAALFFEFVYDNAPEYHCMRGLPTAVLQAVVAQALAGATAFPSLELEVSEVSFADARKGKGVDAKLLAAIAEKRPLRRTVVAVERLQVGGAAANAGIRAGDLLLHVNGQSLSGPADLQRTLATLAGVQVPVEVWRDKCLQKLEAAVTALPPAGIKRLLCWHGMLIARTPRAHEEAWGRRPSCLPGVTVLSLLLGSPAGEEEGFRSNTWIAAADGREVGDLNDLIHTSRKASGSGASGQTTLSSSRPPCVVVTLIDGHGLSYVRTLRPDPVFWPTIELSLTPKGWERTLWE